MNILVLAAGYGNRMDDLTKNIPKPMLKINQKMLIDYAIEIAQKISHQRIFVNTHYQNQILESYIKENYIDIFISHEPNILGTGGAIKKIQNDDLLVLNTDNLWQETFVNEIKESINFFNEHPNLDFEGTILKFIEIMEILNEKMNNANDYFHHNISKLDKEYNFNKEEIANIKLPDLNTTKLSSAMKIVEGTARNMGISIVD